MKTCKKCGKKKKLDNFYFINKEKGYKHSYCKKCLREINKEWYENNKEKARAYCKKWIENNKEKYLALIRKWQREHPEFHDRNLMPSKSLEKLREADKRYQKKKRQLFPEIAAEPKRRWAEEHPEAAKSHAMLNYALKKKWIKRLPCWICGRKDSHGHHEDYSKPMEAIWLCSIHHKRWHLGTIGRKDML